MNRIYTLLASTALLTAATAADALVISTNGSLSSRGVAASIIAAPADANDDAAANDAIQAFNERQSVKLLVDLVVDGGVIAAGTRVDSHMVFLNSAQQNSSASLIDHGTNGTAAATFKFATAILGVMSASNGAQEVASSMFLGALNTLYPNATFAARGMEGDPQTGLNDDYYAFAGDTLTIGMRVTEPGDWVRVITVAAVPVPGSLALLGTALVGAAAMRRRKKAA